MRIEVVELANQKFAVRKRGWFSPWRYLYHYKSIHEYGWIMLPASGDGWQFDSAHDAELHYNLGNATPMAVKKVIQ